MEGEAMAWLDTRKCQMETFILGWELWTLTPTITALPSTPLLSSPLTFPLYHTSIQTIT
jgi:hypothetical protein